jgi:hypothetical protein
MSLIRLFCLVVLTLLSTIAGVIAVVFHVIVFARRQHMIRANQPSRAARRGYEGHLVRVERRLMAEHASRR